MVQPVAFFSDCAEQSSATETQSFALRNPNFGGIQSLQRRSEFTPQGGDRRIVDRRSTLQGTQSFALPWSFDIFCLVTRVPETTPARPRIPS